MGDDFTIWMAGADLEKGYFHGQTDEPDSGHEQLT